MDPLTDAFWSTPQADLLTRTGSSANGLSAEEARERLIAAKSKTREKSALRKDITDLLRQFSDPLVLLLVAAVILSAILGETSDVVIISAILLATGTLSFWQERNAGRAVAALRSMVRLNSIVIRSGQELVVPSDEVVPGDIVRLRAGAVIPADMVLLETNELHVNEAALTGESFPVRKELGTVDADAPISARKNALWQGSNVISGTATALVIHTNGDTIFGKLEKSIETTTPTAFELGIRQFGFFLMRVTIVLAIGILILNVVFHRPVLESVLFALALAVGMAPELLPAIMTIAMSAGAKRMLAKKVIVKKLASIQNLGEVDLLCTDKTGTLTEGVIRVAGMRDGDDKEDAFTRTLACVNASFETGFSDPIDDALKQLGADVSGYERVGEVPYDFIRKRLSIAVKHGDGTLLITKGAVANVIDSCTSIRSADGSTAPIAEHRQALQAKFEAYSSDGFRVIAVGYRVIARTTVSKEDETDMVFAGFVLMEDPLKEGVTQAIEELRTLGVGLKIITGDNRFCAAHVAKKFDMRPDLILTGPEITQLSPEALVAKAREAEIFAEIGPDQKEMIIRALQKGGGAVAYMGDGINDVAAIDAADAGISVNDAVDVAREAADLVLLEKDLSVLADGIREGRRTFTNTLKYILINTGATFGNMFSVAIASLMLPYLPMLPTQILLTNFLTDFPYMAVSSDNVDEEQIQRPGHWDLKSIRSFMVVFGLHSTFFDVLTFLTLFSLLKVSEGVFQTGWFLESVLTELFILFIIRTRKTFLRSVPGRSLMIFSAMAFVLTIALIYAPFDSAIDLHALPVQVVGCITLILMTYVVTADLLKRWFFKRFAPA